MHSQLVAPLSRFQASRTTRASVDCEIPATEAGGSDTAHTATSPHSCLEPEPDSGDQTLTLTFGIGGIASCAC